ncbi:GntR family transcriptional regulator [Candidatus Soleaferrea massiliensis]|uniref:GntR family transcriptional regulator n=1 Tax=Candidatus Soleaferrea massiliensis TaxID=1470354 RepID=UPI00058B41F6|nr:GntR family transcriptional regulator [Candidatus Soleaferrea massiliensis]
MKNDVIQYDRAYWQIKNKIECGILPVGSKLPGRAALCRQLGTSERTIRRVLKLLEQDGFLEIMPRKSPRVISPFPSLKGRALQNTRKTNAAQVDDLMRTADLLCYPIYLRGLRLCAGDDWRTPEWMLGKMDPNRPEEFWRLSSRLGRFFIARNENELLLRAVDSLGFQGKEPPLGSLEDRTRYRAHIETLFQTVKSGGAPGRAELDAIFSQYRAIAEQAGEVQFLQLRSPCPMLAEADGLDQQLCLAQERYSSMCLDLLGLIAIGRYQPGDHLPTHDQLQKYYGVSRDTSVKAVRMLREWGVVTAAPRRGISVEMDLAALQKIRIAPESIACHVRRYLDSLDLLSLTVERAAAHAAAHVKSKDVQRLRETMLGQLEQPYEHQLIPRTLLDFITEHIQYDALRSIYGVLARNFSIGRSIPKLVSRDKNPQNRELYRQCAEAADILLGGDAGLFAERTADIFERVRHLVVSECKRLGYWEAAMQVYDGASLWQ